MCSCRDILADTQTDRQTDTVITMLRSPVGGGVITHYNLTTFTQL